MDRDGEIKETWKNSSRWGQHIDKINHRYSIHIIETKNMIKTLRISESKNTQNNKNRNR